MINLLIFAAVIVAATLIAIWRGRGPAVSLLVFITLAAIARRLFVIAGEVDLEHIGIANAAVEIQSYQLALLISWLFLPLVRVLRNLPITYALLVPYLLVVALVQGDLVPAVGNGIMHMAFAAIAWAVGAVLMELNLTGKFSDRALVITLLVPVLIQIGLSAMQLLGLRDVGAVETAGILLVRINGSTGHPGTLGKLMFLLLLPLFPLTTSKDKVARLLAWCGVGAVAIIVGLTFGRANVAAVVGALAIWVVFGPGRKILARIIAAVAVAVASIPVVIILLQRSASDPEGGRRPQLIEPALNQIRQTFWFGVGPNDYVRTVGEHSPLTALGYSVHNTFLLALTEFGAIGLALFVLPFLVTAVVAVIAIVRRADSRGFALAYLGVLPGLVFNAATGWGLLQAEVFVLLMLVCGMSSRAIRIQQDLDMHARVVGALSRSEARMLRKRPNRKKNLHASS